MPKVAKVAVEKANFSYDRLYDYLIPEGMEAAAGMRVTVPFGRGKNRLGLVVSVDENADFDSRLKKIISLADSTPVLSAEGLYLLRWLKEFTFCTWFDALSVLIPRGLGKNLHTRYSLSENIDEALLSEREKSFAAHFPKGRKAVDDSSFGEDFPDAEVLLKSLIAKGAVIATETAVRKIEDKTAVTVKLTQNYGEVKLTEKQEAAAEALLQYGEISLKELMYFTGVSRSVVEKLVKSGAAEFGEEEILRNPYSDIEYKEPEEIILTESQQKAADGIFSQYSEKKKDTALLFGVTGSGKTKVFITLARKIADMGKSVIILVPEISLTPQTIGQFHMYFKEKVAVLHSSLSPSERLDEWKRIKRGEATVVVGTRSAVFAPVDNLGLIVIDEEQEYTYKSESAPRFDAREAAKIRAKYNGGLLLLASATPSVESFYKAKTGEYGFYELTERFGSAKLPDVTIIDRRGDMNPGETISDSLAEEILYNLKHGEQTILLMNRRGHSTNVKCMSCHKPVMCPNCSISMKYHMANNRLVCHYCGYSRKIPDKCPECGSKYVSYLGAGTQKIEQELNIRFPEARVLRMDTDTTMRKFSHEKLLRAFANKEYDIMVGTQMVAKGLNFPDVTLVGVLGTDQMLFQEDFRSYERVFDLITQVVGRSGRSEKRGRAFIETCCPDNPILTLAAKQQYKEFFKEEILSRKISLYPPYCRLFCVGINGRDEAETAAFANSVYKILAGMLKEKYSDIPVRLLGLSQSSLYKIAGKFRYRIILKVRMDRRTRELMKEFLTKASSSCPTECTVYVDSAGSSI